MKAGEGCPKCDGTLDVFKALEVGHIFKLGTKYSDSLKATVLDGAGAQVPLVMGSYGIGVERILAAAIELHNDQDGIRFPLAIAPFQATVLTLGKEPELVAAGDQVVAALAAAGVEVLYDDRDERAGREVQGRRPARHAHPHRGGQEGAGRGQGGVEAPRAGRTSRWSRSTRWPRRPPPWCGRRWAPSRSRGPEGRTAVRAKLSIGFEGEVAVPPREARSLGLAPGDAVDVAAAPGAFLLVTPARPGATPSSTSPGRSPRSPWSR